MKVKILEKTIVLKQSWQWRWYFVEEGIEVARKVTGHEISAEVRERREGDPEVLIDLSEKAKRRLGWELGLIRWRRLLGVSGSGLEIILMDIKTKSKFLTKVYTFLYPFLLCRCK